MKSLTSDPVEQDYVTGDNPVFFYTFLLTSF